MCFLFHVVVCVLSTPGIVWTEEELDIYLTDPQKVYTSGRLLQPGFIYFLFVYYLLLLFLS
jgi:hypothetical protein